jgi:pimeloyl-ACP methyl ester carboxylesterase
MSRASRRRLVGACLSLMGAGFSALAWFKYRRDIQRARERISAGSRIAETPCGPIEYAQAGDGPPVLVVHGAGGGFDQAMFLAEPLFESGLRVIAVSRFGYLRTPLPADPSATAQADAHACLLDALGIPRVTVLGASAGAPSSMQFALRHPERTAALVLLVPAAYPAHIASTSRGVMPRRTTPETALLFDTALKSDFFFWLAPRIARRTVLRGILATPPSVVEQASAAERARVAGVLARASQRRRNHVVFAPLRPRANRRAHVHHERRGRFVRNLRRRPVQCRAHPARPVHRLSPRWASMGGAPRRTHGRDRAFREERRLEAIAMPIRPRDGCRAEADRIRHPRHYLCSGGLNIRL